MRLLSISLPPSLLLFNSPFFLRHPIFPALLSPPTLLLQFQRGEKGDGGRGGRRHNRSLLSHFRIFPLPFFFPLTFSTNHPFFFSIFLFHFQQLPLPLPPFCTIPLSPPRRLRFLLSPLEPTLKWYGGGAGRRRHAMQPVCARGGGEKVGKWKGRRGEKQKLNKMKLRLWDEEKERVGVERSRQGKRGSGAISSPKTNLQKWSLRERCEKRERNEIFGPVPSPRSSSPAPSTMSLSTSSCANCTPFSCRQRRRRGAVFVGTSAAAASPLPSFQGRRQPLLDATDKRRLSLSKRRRGPFLSL